MTPTCNESIRLWLAEIEGPTFDPKRAAQAARTLAVCLNRSPQLQQLFEAMANRREDRISCETCQALLPEYIHAQLNFDYSTQAELPNPDVTNHLALCPYCVAAYAEASDLVLAYADLTLPVAASYPAFDLLHADQKVSTASPTPAWSPDLVRRALAEGKQWVEDALGGIYLLFQPGWQAQPAALGIKSGEPGRLLAETVWSEEGEGWEVEAAAFADVEQSDLCRVEVTVYRIGDPDGALDGLAVTLRYGEVTHAQMTDESGVIEFVDIPMAELAQCAIHVSLPPSPRTS